MLKLLFLETRPQYLLLSVILAFLGTSIAWYYQGTVNAWYAVLAGFGIVLTHISVNTLNDYFDYKSGIDLKTEVTPFSGGSGMLKAGLLKPRHVLWLGITALLFALPIGIYFIIVKGWLLLPLLLIAVICIVLYSPLILKHNWPEWSAGLGLGMLPVLGSYFVQTGAYSVNVFLAAVPSLILVHNLLLINEFPDVEADRSGGRKTLPITMGIKKAAIIFSVLTLMVYLWIAGIVIAGIAPVWALLAFLSAPFAAISVLGLYRGKKPDSIINSMKNNVIVVLATQLLLAAGYLLGAVL
ncbi:MAG: prenyltransferase [Actinobacteria bacterium]|nr:prenyltransferase [Actinomycetota bacterium]